MKKQKIASRQNNEKSPLRLPVTLAPEQQAERPDCRFLPFGLLLRVTIALIFWPFLEFSFAKVGQLNKVTGKAHGPVLQELGDFSFEASGHAGSEQPYQRSGRGRKVFFFLLLIQ